MDSSSIVVLIVVGLFGIGRAIAMAMSSRKSK